MTPRCRCGCQLQTCPNCSGAGYLERTVQTFGDQSCSRCDETGYFLVSKTEGYYCGCSSGKVKVETGSEVIKEQFWRCRGETLVGFHCGG